MKIIDFKQCKKKVKPLCPSCDVSMIWDGNEHDGEEIWGLDTDKYNYGWFVCPSCEKKFLVEDYDEDESVIEKNVGFLKSIWGGR